MPLVPDPKPNITCSFEGGPLDGAVWSLSHERFYEQNGAISVGSGVRTESGYMPSVALYVIDRDSWDGEHARFLLHKR